MRPLCPTQIVYRHLKVVGAKPPRSSPIRPPPGGLEAGCGRCSQLLSDAKHPQHPRNGFWLGRSPLKKSPLELHIKFRGLYTSSLGIHCAVSAQGVRQGVNQEVRLKARKVRVMSGQCAPRGGVLGACWKPARLFHSSRHRSAYILSGPFGGWYRYVRFTCVGL
jgi:hypothetical protein